MKKTIISIMCMFIFSIAFAEGFEIKKIKEFPQGNLQKGLYLRKDVGEDDFSRNYICFDENGVLYNYQDDSHRMMKFTNELNLLEEHILDLSRNPFRININNNLFVFDGYYGSLKVFDKEKVKISISMSKIIQDNSILDGNYYYNPEYDFVLFSDKESNIHCIMHPSTNEEENRKNYKTPKETQQLFSENSENGKKGILIKDKTLYENGVIYYWYGAQINGYMFYTLDSNIYLFKNNELVNTINLSSENEQFESAAVHPSGDIYILRMNWNTNTHNLYCIENTWDTQWRVQWYKDHPSAVRP